MKSHVKSCSAAMLLRSSSTFKKIKASLHTGEIILWESRVSITRNKQISNSSSAPLEMTKNSVERYENRTCLCATGEIQWLCFCWVFYCKIVEWSFFIRQWAIIETVHFYVLVAEMNNKIDCKNQRQYFSLVPYCRSGNQARDPRWSPWKATTVGFVINRPRDLSSPLSSSEHTSTITEGGLLHNDHAPPQSKTWKEQLLLCMFLDLMEIWLLLSAVS